MDLNISNVVFMHIILISFHQEFRLKILCFISSLAKLHSQGHFGICYIREQHGVISYKTRLITMRSKPDYVEFFFVVVVNVVVVFLIVVAVQMG